MNKILIAVIILAIVGAGAYVYMHPSLQKLSIAGACQPWANIYPGLSCRTTADCAAQINNGQPIDASIQLRCSAGACQAQTSACSGEVTP